MRTTARYVVLNFIMPGFEVVPLEMNDEKTGEKRNYGYRHDLKGDCTITFGNGVVMITDQHDTGRQLVVGAKEFIATTNFD